jgi:hypothetical protein
VKEHPKEVMHMLNVEPDNPIIGNFVSLVIIVNSKFST